MLNKPYFLAPDNTYVRVNASGVAFRDLAVQARICSDRSPTPDTVLITCLPARRHANQKLELTNTSYRVSGFVFSQRLKKATKSFEYAGSF